MRIAIGANHAGGHRRDLLLVLRANRLDLLDEHLAKYRVTGDERYAEQFALVADRFQSSFADIDTLALDLIDRIGPAGNFLSEDHTVDHIKDLWMPNLIDRTDFNTWQANGSLPLEKKLNERVIWILENHTPEPLKAGVLEAINGVIERAERKYRK